ncbi:ATPase/protein kinase [Nakamurella endophytica]|uniref:ATPase/protein kinase n=1 Tax=Nakamurella endophytica TaxID=1748367 RepID=A0A917SY38_9ACTN|nr:ATPase/protein kinase [Nakamurella endophytica]
MRQGSRSHLARAITLVESTRADDRALARRLLAALGPDRGTSVRVGISGTPGVGKSTFVQTLGLRLTGRGHRVGVLAVDPSSPRTGGSVLGDKTRMPLLAAEPSAFIRPSPTAGTLGGVTRATASAIRLVEAAGHDVVLVETVGVGQSETAVSGMVDTFLLLALARSGDRLQGIKKGVLEIADVLAVNKADGDHVAESRAAAADLAAALRLVQGGSGAVPPVLTCSALTGDGIDEVWAAVRAHRDRLGADGLRRRRADQQVALTWSLVRDELEHRLRRDPAVRSVREDVETAVRDGALDAAAAADRLLAAFSSRPADPAGAVTAPDQGTPAG